MHLHYGNETVDITLPDGFEADRIMYNVPAQIENHDYGPIIKHALEYPVSSLTLKELARNKRNAAIIISDISRLCPSYIFLPYLLDELNAGGIPDDKITVIVALGLHRRQTEDELRQLTGSVYNRVAVINHSSQPENCVYVGTTRIGTKVEINKRVVEAELRIATGNIEPHRLVGISGGAKALFPGVASARSIEQNHSLSHQFTAAPGNPDNPIHRDIEESLQFVKVDFLFNVVVTHRRAIVGAIAGHVREAHRIGSELAKSMFLVKVPRKYDIVIASAGGYPKDMQLYQAVKTLENASQITKPGGSIILVARCQELFGNGTFQLWAETMGELNDTAEQLARKFVIGAHKIEHIVKVTKNYKVKLYSDIPEPIAALLGFQPVRSINACLSELCSEGKTLAVMPCGSITYPV